MSDYEPGTVAVATVRGVPNVRLFRVQWTASNGEDCGGWLRADDRLAAEVTDVRPLVVLDLTPEQARLVVRILRGCANADDQADSHPGRGLVTSTAYRAAADQIEAQTRPPKPEEPTGLGAVVEDAEGERWVRSHPHVTSPWTRPHLSGTYAWPQVAAVRVLSEGVA